MSRKRNKLSKQPKPIQSKRGKKNSLRLIKESLTLVGGLSGSILAIYGLVKTFKDDAEGFSWLIPVGVVIWLIILWRLFQVRKTTAYSLFIISILVGVVGWISWQSQVKATEDKVVVLVAQFDGPEDTYGIGRQMMEDLLAATKGYKDTQIIAGEQVVTSSEYARELGEKAKADLVIWAWYRPTENPNITMHFENLSDKQIRSLSESETYQPTSTLAELESFEIQKKLGSETSTMIVFLTGLLRYEAGDYQIALERFDQTLQYQAALTTIDLSSLHFYRGFSEYELGLFKEAIDDYGKVIQLNPDLSEAYVNRGNAYDELAQPQRAIQDFNKAIELNPQLAAAYYNRGIAYDNLDQNDHAIRDFNEVIKINPQYKGAYRRLGIAYGKNEQYELAIESFDKAIEIDPLDAKAYSDRGVAYTFMGKYQRAIQDLEKAIKLAPSLADAYYNRGIAYGELRHYKEALQDFDKTIQIDPHYSDAYRNRGLVYQVLGRIAEAEADFKKYEELTGQKP